MCALPGQASHAREKGKERLNSALLDVLHSANQHGNVIHGFMVSIEGHRLPAEAFGGMSVVVGGTARAVKPTQPLKGDRQVRQPRRTISAAHGENDFDLASPHLTKLESC